MIFLRFIFLFMGLLLARNKGYQKLSSASQLRDEMQRDHHMIILGYNKTLLIHAKGRAREFLTDFSNQEISSKDSFKFYMIDLNNFPLLVERHNITRTFAFFYSIGSELIPFNEFGLLAEAFYFNKLTSKRLSNYALKFLRYQVGKLRHEIKSMHHFQKILEREKIITVFLGSENGHQERVVFRLACKHTHHTFHRVFNRELANAIYKRYHGLDRTDEQELFCFVRHETALSLYDHMAFVCMKAKDDYHKYKLFYDREAHPKLLNGADIELIEQKYYKPNHKLFIYVYDNESPNEDLEAFRRAVIRIPKYFIFVEFNVSKHDIQPLARIFMDCSSQVIKNQVSFLSHKKINGQIVLMKTQINERNIVNFALHLADHHSHHFDNLHIRKLKKDMKDFPRPIDEL